MSLNCTAFAMAGCLLFANTGGSQVACPSIEKGSEHSQQQTQQQASPQGSTDKPDQQQSGNKRPPNILFFFADDWGRHASAYAKIDGPGTMNDVVATPNFDRIASEGVLFRRAFVSAPSCTPCRSALFSGQHFWRTGRGAILRGAVWDSQIPAFPLILQGNGYHIGKTFKAWSPGQPADAPIGGNSFAYDKFGGRFNQFSQNATKMLDAGKDLSQVKQTLVDDVLKNLDDFLAARNQDQPFLYFLGPTNTHRKWIQGSGKQLWDIDPIQFQGKLPAFLPDVETVRQDLADYFGEIQALDLLLGAIRDRLEQTGQLSNTMIVISGDHGAPGFPYGKCNLYDFGSSVPLAIRWDGIPGGRVVDDLVSLTDLAPTFLELAGLEIPQEMTGRSLLPLLQSDRSGQVEPNRDAVFLGRERHVESARADFAPYPQRAIRTADHLYIINFRPDRWPLGDPYRLEDATPVDQSLVRENTRTTLPDEDAGPTKAWLVSVRNESRWADHFSWVYGKRPREELYDLARDPYQLHNVAADPDYQAIRLQLESRLLDTLRQTGDPRMVDDGKYFETPPLAGPVDDPQPKL